MLVRLIGTDQRMLHVTELSAECGRADSQTRVPFGRAGGVRLRCRRLHYPDRLLTPSTKTGSQRGPVHDSLIGGLQVYLSGVERLTVTGLFFKEW